MASMFGCALLALIVGGLGGKVTPVEEVISLIQKMKDASAKEGEDEAKTYKEFSCFCQKTTEDKSKALVKGSDDIIMYSASIEEASATKNEKVADLLAEKKSEEANKKALAESEAQCEATHAEYVANEADASKAIYDLTQAISSLENSKPTLLQIGVKENLVQILAMADAMNMIQSPKHQALSAFLQTDGKAAFLQQKAAVDPADPTYKYHSDDIIALCQKLLGEFQDKKKDLDDAWAEADRVCKSTQKTLKEKIENNGKAIRQLTKDIDALQTKMSEDLDTLAKTKAAMLDDKLYLKDLTKQCEDSAADWDQRSTLRKNELETLTEALAILRDVVAPTDKKANLRAFEPKKAFVQVKPISFMQLEPVTRAVSLQQGSSKSKMILSSQARMERALDTLRSEGKRLNSVALQSLSHRLGADPFFKVKELIQKLLERLVSEAAAEAEKKGYCDEEMAKAESDRDYRYADVLALNAEVAELEAKRDVLTNNIATFKADVKKLSEDLKEATKLRDADKKDNLETIATAKVGLEALKKCIDILATFYRVSARATVLAQVSPVDEDTTGAGFEGAYKGQQTRSVAILDMLDDIKSDYERTIRMRTEEEAKAHAEFTEFKRTSEADISGKSKGLELDDEDLETTLNTIASKMGDLQTNMDLLDKAIQKLVALNPMCVDSGMSYKERTETRQAEIAALKKALCQLDADKVEDECK